MRQKYHVQGLLFTIATIAAAAPLVADAQVPTATYDFGGEFAALQPGEPPVTLISPLGTSGFVVVSVFGEQRTVLALRGDASPSTNQSGLSVPASLSLPTSNYTVEMIVRTTDDRAGFRRLLDVSNRQSDSGFYVDPSAGLYVYPTGGSTSNLWTNGTFYHVVLTVSETTTVAYLNRQPVLQVASGVMNLVSGIALGVLIDNLGGGGQNEWSPSEIALLRLYNSVLTPPQVGLLDNGTPRVCSGCSFADLRVGGACPDGIVDGSDFIAFINSFSAGDVAADPNADVNNDGSIDGADFVAFINAFAMGC